MSIATDRSNFAAALPAVANRSDADAGLSHHVLEISTDCVKVLDPTGNLLFMNRNGLGVMEIDQFESVRGKPWALFWPAESRPLVRQSIDAALRGDLGHFVAACPTAKGTPKWWDVSVALVPHADEHSRRLIAISRDITAQRKADEILRISNEQMKFATSEMAHRINNTLAVVQSIINQTAKTTPDPAEFAKAVSRRIGAMASANRALVNSDWDGADLDALIRQELGAHIADTDPRLQTSGPHVALPSRCVVAFALIVHELATNAVKYGAWLNDSGKIELDWSVAPRAEGGRMLSFLWRERGGPPVLPPAHKGFGSVLLERGVDDCKVDREFDPAGLTCRIALPL